MIALFLSLTILPAILAILSGRSAQRLADAGSEEARSWFGNLAQWIIPRRRLALGIVVATVAVVAAGIPRIEIDDRFVQYFDESVTFRTDTDHVNARLTGVYNASFDLESGEEGGVSDPQYLNRLEAFTTWLEEQPEVVNVNSLADIMKRLNKNMHADDPAWYVQPEDRELAAQYLLLFELSLPFGLDLTNVVDVDKSATKVTATLQDLSTNQMRDLESRANAWLVEHASGVMTGVASSPSVMFSHISKRNVDSMISGTILSLILITIVLMIALKSVRFGILSLAPNVLPIAVGFGAWGYLVGNIGMAVATIAGLTLGIVVDDTVHIISKYRYARIHLKQSPEQAVQTAYRYVGRALVITTVILVLGFGILTQSTFRMNWSMGVLSAITLGLRSSLMF